MTQFSKDNTPGMQAAVTSKESQVWWSGRGGQNLLATNPLQLDAANVDAGNSPTTTIRSGNLVARNDTTGIGFLYDPDANDGRQIAVGVLEHALDMLSSGVATQRFTQMLVHGLLKENELVGLDPRAKTQLAGRFLFDDDPTASSGELMHPRGVYRKAADYTVTASDNGLLMLATNAVTFTLPTKQNGLAFRFLQTTNNNMVIAGSSDLLHKGSSGADTVTFSTTSEKIGSHVLVECLYTAESTLRWVVTNLGGTTATVA